MLHIVALGVTSSFLGASASGGQRFLAALCPAPAPPTTCKVLDSDGPGRFQKYEICLDRTCTDYNTGDLALMPFKGEVYWTNLANTLKSCSSVEQKECLEPAFRYKACGGNPHRCVTLTMDWLSLCPRTCKVPGYKSCTDYPGFSQKKVPCPAPGAETKPTQSATPKFTPISKPKACTMSSGHTNARGFAVAAKIHTQCLAKSCMDFNDQLTAFAPVKRLGLKACSEIKESQCGQRVSENMFATFSRTYRLLGLWKRWCPRTCKVCTSNDWV